jgi:hypothetical protein
MLKSLALVVSAMYLITLGIICLFYPDRFQEWNLRLRVDIRLPEGVLLRNDCVWRTRSLNVGGHGDGQQYQG